MIRRTLFGEVKEYEFDIRKAEEIISAIFAVVKDYTYDTGREPIAILLGPREYWTLKTFTKNDQTYRLLGVSSTEALEQLAGFKIFVKEMPGIELMIDEETAVRYF